MFPGVRNSPVSPNEKYSIELDGREKRERESIQAQMRKIKKKRKRNGKNLKGTMVQGFLYKWMENTS